ncbi:hypothetical protein [Sulfurivirga sp.]|uniref:hypothetical protein n=1 Tax=Sulfurivirga sp. TaxID=2614236 RepID=UPI0025DEFB46|nr:hypothetical protein [Sulfurivirga sp.]
MRVDLFDEFKVVLPGAFEPSLAMCRFSEGEVIHSDIRGYHSPVWADAVPYMRWSVQIIKQYGSGSSFEEGWNSNVKVRIHHYKDGGWVNDEVLMTKNGALYRLLLTGDLEVLGQRVGDPPAGPDFALKSLNTLRNVGNEKTLKNYLSIDSGEEVFVVPYCRASHQTKNKLRRIEMMLRPLEVSVSHHRIAGTPLANILGMRTIRPTVWLAVFSTKHSSGVMSRLVYGENKPYYLTRSGAIRMACSTTKHDKYWMCIKRDPRTLLIGRKRKFDFSRHGIWL